MENRSKPASLLTAESITLGVRHEKVGKLRVTYAGWDDAKVVLDAQLLQFGKSQPKTEAAPSVGLPPTEALARELDQAADATVRAMNEVGSAPAALALYRRDEDVPPSTGLPTPGCHLALVRRVVEHQEDHMIRIRNRITRRELLATAASGCALSAFGSLAKPYLSFAAERPLVSHGVQS